MPKLSQRFGWLARGMASRSQVAVRPARPAAIESLEGRRMFAAAPPVAPFVDEGGVLQVAGTNKADVIVVALSADKLNVDVTVNGVVTPVLASTVTGGVNVSGGNGSDDLSVVEATAGDFTLAVTMSGGNGKDMLTGASGADTLDGGNASDTLEGLAGDDTLRGGNGKDALDGGDGADTLDGGRGKDAMVGGLGADRFVGKKQEAEAQDETAEDLFDPVAPKKGNKP